MLSPRTPLLLVLLFGGGLASATQAAPSCTGFGCATLDLPAGTLRGNAWDHGQEFLMVPYATVPTGRFGRAVVSEHLPQPEFDATNILGDGRAACLQPPYTSTTDSYGVENCLILNLYTPVGGDGDDAGTNGTTAELRPILLWIFGGDNAASEIIPYNATLLAGLHDAVVAVVSYRLGAFGFAAFAEDLAPRAGEARDGAGAGDGSTNSAGGTGNNGMHDVLAAAAWLRRAAPGLGADPNRIIAFGESSGGTDAQLLTLSPAARGVIHGSISESGGLYAQSLDEAIKNTRKVGAAVGCHDPLSASSAASAASAASALHPSMSSPPPSSSSSAPSSFRSLKACMASKTGAAIVQAASYYDWGPTIDGIFLTQDPSDVLNEEGLNPGVSVLWGSNTNDSASPYALAYYVNESSYIDQLNATIHGEGGHEDKGAGREVGDGVAGGVYRKKISGHRHHRRVDQHGSSSDGGGDDDDVLLGQDILQQALALYPPRKHSSNADLVGWFSSDKFMCGARRETMAASKAAAKSGNVGEAAYMYRFDWFFQSDKRCIADSNWHIPESGSNHCDEMTFVMGQPIFDNQDPPGYSYTNCSDPASHYYDKKRCTGCHFDPSEAAFSAAVGQYWTQFARTGRPTALATVPATVPETGKKGKKGDERGERDEVAWPAFTLATRENLVLHPDAVRVEADLGRAEACALWDLVAANTSRKRKRKAMKAAKKAKAQAQTQTQTQTHTHKGARMGVGMAAAAAKQPPLPTGPTAPHVTPAAPTPNFNWDRVPTSFHGAVKDREFTDAEVARLARYQMATIEKWYTPCGSAGPPHQSGPECAVEHKAEALFARVRVQSTALGLPRPTAILYWNTMFDFSMYAAHARMMELEAAGTHAFLRDETGAVISLCNDGNVYCNITTYDWTEPKVRALWIEAVTNATKNGIDGIFADHSANQGVHIGVTEARGVRPAQGANQLCNGAGKHSRCFNFTDTFRDSFNSWHLWATNYTQDLLSRTTGGPVIQGPLASMNNATSWGGNITDPDYCDFDGIREAQASSGMAVFEARGSCKIKEKCLAAYLAAAERGTYIHCTYSGDDLLTATAFPEMDNHLGEPHGPAKETHVGSNIWVRHFASGTVATWDNTKKTGTVKWANV